MTLWLVPFRAPTGRRIYVVDLDTNPSPTIMAQGLACNPHSGHVYHGQYEIVEDGAVNPRRPENKPPYRVPSMAEVDALPPNGLTVASLFSGCGGSCLGFRMAGYRIAFANEFVDAARAVYAANNPTTPLDARDVRDLSADDVLRAAGVAAGDIDVLEGSPPCASFSTAGKRNKTWGEVRSYSDVAQRSDDLFFEFARLLRGIQPRAFVAENVSGLLKGVAKGYFKEILGALRACGYVVEARLLDAQWLGVPQQRQRVIFIGIRNDLAASGLAPAFPRPLPYRYTVRDALGSIDLRYVRHGPNSFEVPDNGADRPALTIGAMDSAGSWSRYEVRDVVRVVHDTGGFARDEDVLDRPAPTITNAGGAAHTHFLVEGVGPPDRDTFTQRLPGRTFNGARSLDEPSPTVLTHRRQHTNGELTIVQSPVERRKLTIAELKRLCAFPDDFDLAPAGTYARQWERLGRAVPPLMMRAVADVLARQLLDARARCAG